jgi:hypothetical protein
MTEMPWRAASKGDLASVLGMDAGQDLDKGRLARPVLAGQDMNLPWAEVEGYLFQDGNAGKGLADPPHAEEQPAVIRSG